MNRRPTQDPQVDLVTVSTAAACFDAKRRRLSSLLDGEFPWGAIVASAPRYGASQQRLVVYPPGITLQERRWLRVWRGWPIWGGFVWFVLQVFLGPRMAPAPATAIACGVAALAGAAAFVMAGANRPRVRTLNCFAYAAAEDPDIVEGQHIFRLLSTTLVAADRHHRRGELSYVGYEHIWWQVYNAMAPEARKRASAES